jgi:hypothetical protein
MNSATPAINLKEWAILFVPPHNLNYTLPLSFIYELFYQTRTSAILYLSVFMLFAFLGILLNCLTFYILRNEEFKEQKSYTYWRVATIPSICNCILQIFNALFSSQALIPATGSLEWTVYGTIALSYLVSSLSFFRTCIDINVVLDRTAMFEPRAKVIFKFGPYVNMAIMFFVCFSMNITQLFLYKIDEYGLFLLGEFCFTHLYGAAPSNFARTPLGLLLYYSLIFVRNLGTLAAELALNILSIFLFRRFMEMLLSRI